LNSLTPRRGKWEGFAETRGFTERVLRLRGLSESIKRPAGYRTN